MQDYKKILMLLALSLPAKSSLAGSGDDLDYKYKPVIDLSATKYAKNRNIGEVDVMMPLWQDHSNLTILDVKFKKDRKSREYNIGFVYRHNFDDQWIFGIYNYFDNRKTQYLRANQWTFGVEALSHYLDLRFNAYLPQNKKKTIYTTPRELRIENTRVYAVSPAKFEERTLSGYDIELGMPLFGLMPNLDEKFGTRIHLSRYDFRRKGVAKYTGTRLRLEQSLFESEERALKFILNLGTQYGSDKKFSNFVGLGLRIPLFAENASRTKLQKRMMDPVIRDVDIRTRQVMSREENEMLFDKDGRSIERIYFVGDQPEDGDGTKERPLSSKQHNKLLEIQKDSRCIIVPVGKFSAESYERIMDSETAIDHRTQEIVLTTSDQSAWFKANHYFPDLEVEGEYMAKEIDQVMLDQLIAEGKVKYADEYSSREEGSGTNSYVTYYYNSTAPEYSSAMNPAIPLPAAQEEAMLPEANIAPRSPVVGSPYRSPRIILLSPIRPANSPAAISAVGSPVIAIAPLPLPESPLDDNDDARRQLAFDDEEVQANPASPMSPVRAYRVNPAAAVADPVVFRRSPRRVARIFVAPQPLNEGARGFQDIFNRGMDSARTDDFRRLNEIRGGNVEVDNRPAAAPVRLPEGARRMQRAMNMGQQDAIVEGLLPALPAIRPRNPAGRRP